MTARYVFEGVDMVASGPNDPAALYAEAAHGAGKLPARFSASMLPIVSRLASSAPTAMTVADREAVEAMGIKLVDATDDARRAESVKLLATGATPEAINSRPATSPYYRAVHPVRITRTFVPAPKGY